MHIVVHGRNIEVTDALREYVSRRLTKLTRLWEKMDTAQVSLAVERGRHVVEVTLPVQGRVIRAEERSNDMYASIDLVMDKLERQIQRYRARLMEHRADRGEARQEQPSEEGDVGRLVRTKRFPVKPMTPEEAILELNLVGHDFFVFVNAETNAVNVLYRRRDGNYGLLVPEA